MTTRKISIATLIVALCISSGHSQTIPAGYTKTTHGLLYKIIVDNKKPKAKVGDILKMNVTYSTQNDSVLFSTYEEDFGPVQFNITPPTFNGDPMEGFILVGEGDSAIFMMPADSAYKKQEMPPFAKKGDYIRIRFSVVSVMSPEEYEKKKAEEAKMQIDMESKTIEDYLAKNNLKAQKTASGIYYIIEKQGEGPKVEAGKTLSVNYTGKVMDGGVFDSSLKPGGQPLEFKLGTFPLIKGWDEGLPLFNQGGKGILIIPSPLGYGSRPHGPDIPANSILVFDIEVLSVK